MTMGLLASTSMRRFEETGDRRDLDRAIDNLGVLVEMTPPGDHNYTENLNRLASVLLTRYELAKDRIDLDGAVQAYRTVVDATPSEAPERVVALVNLATALNTRFERFEDYGDLDEIIKKHYDMLGAVASDHPAYFPLPFMMMETLLRRFGHTKDQNDLDEAIRISMSALPSGTSEYRTGINAFADALLTRYTMNENRNDLDSAVNIYRKVIETTLAGGPDRFFALVNLGAALNTRFERFKDYGDLDEMIEHRYEMLKILPSGHRDRSTVLFKLADMLQCRFEHAGNQKDLDEAIDSYQFVLQTSPSGHSDYCRNLTRLANALLTRFEQAGIARDLTETITSYLAVIEASPPNDSDRWYAFANLSNALRTSFAQFGDPSDLDNALANAIKALELCPPDHPGVFGLLADHATMLVIRFERDGARVDLDESIINFRKALDVIKPNDPTRSMHLSNLASALHIRYTVIHDRVDLDDAILNHGEALDLRPPGHPDRFLSFCNLAYVLRDRFELTGDRADLDAAITNGSHSLELAPPNHPKVSMVLNNFAVSLTARYTLDGRRADLDQAVILHRRALDLKPPGHSGRAKSLYNLATTLQTKFDKFGDRADLDGAILYHRKALELRPPGHSERGGSLLNLARTLETGLDRATSKKTADQMVPTSEQPTQTEMFELFEEATSLAAGESLFVRLQASLDWIDAAVKWSHPSAIRAYRVSLSVLEAYTSSSSSLESRHLRLKFERTNRTQNLAVNAAAYALTEGQVELAVELLDQGRSALLKQAGKYRTRLDELQAVYPDLAREFRAISAKMEGSVMTDERTRPQTNSADTIASYHALSQEWTNVLGRIRALPGFETFLQPTPFAALQAASAEGPIIIVNHSLTRADAIIIQPNGDPLLVRLPKAHPTLIVQMVQKAHHKTGDKDFRNLLYTLWEVIVQPVVQILQTALRLAAGSRIWWCPTGHTSHLPLHAAGDYTKVGQNLPDLFVSSYTPTLSALLHSRQNRSAKDQVSSRMLVVGQPKTPGQIALDSVPLEIARIKAIVADTTVLNGSQGTHDAVLHAISQHSLIHLSCHGHVDQEKPFRSNFSLQDGPLTLLDIAKQDLPQADLAFLSACHSAASNCERPDEALHLAAGLQFAGFRSVIGTLWAMCDQDGPDMAESFYASLLGTGGRPLAKSSAHALHRAVGELRRRGVSYSRWTCFAHFGC